MLGFAKGQTQKQELCWMIQPKVIFGGEARVCVMNTELFVWSSTDAAPWLEEHGTFATTTTWTT
jgi:hypothetical protein